MAQEHVIVVKEEPGVPYAEATDRSPFERRDGEHPWFSSKVIAGAVGMVILGGLEGAVFAASGAFAPAALRYQMVFRVWIILKLFIAAMGSSMVCQGLYSLAKPAWFHNSRFYEQTSVGYPRAVGGCFLLGIGMTLSGSGPTMIPSQIGAGVDTAAITLAGMFLGGLVFAVLEPLLLSREFCKQPGEKTTVEELVGGTYAKWAVPMGAGCVAAATALEFLLPHSDDRDKIDTNRVAPMYPTIAGVCMGLLQVPVRIITGDGLGGSTWYMGVWSTLSCGKLSPRHFFDSMEKLYQAIYMIVGSLVGALIMAQSLNGFDAPSGYPVQQTLTGGFCMMLGARIANGCTCGHGISGTSELSLQSFCAAGAIFAGAIACGYFLAGIDVVDLDY